MPWLVEYRFIDNNNRRAETILRLPDELTFGQASARAEQFAALFAAVSDARLDDFVISRRFPGPAGSTATALASVQHTTVLFYSDGEQTSSIRMPALNRFVAEVDGPYAGIRVTRQSAAVGGILGILDTMLAETLDPTGRPFPGTFYVGGRDDV